MARMSEFQKNGNPGERRDSLQRETREPGRWREDEIREGCLGGPKGASCFRRICRAVMPVNSSRKQTTEQRNLDMVCLPSHSGGIKCL